jgi:hypothetical protein
LYLIMCLHISHGLTRVSSEGNSLDLSSHSQAKEGEKVDEQNRPVHWNIGSAGDSTEKGDSIGLSGRVPKLEFYPSAFTWLYYTSTLTWKSSDEWPELFILITARKSAHQALDSTTRFGSVRSRKPWRSLFNIIRSEVVLHRRIESRL